MQLLFAAPFLLAAALAFTILAAVPRWRRWAILIPTGTIAAGPCFFVAFGAGLWIDHLLGHDTGPERRSLLLYFSLAILAGILGGVAAGIISRFLTGILPRVLLRVTVFIAAGCSYFVLFLALDIAASARWHLPENGWFWSAGAVLSLVGAWLTAANPEPFRSSSFRLPIGAQFHRRVSSAPIAAPVDAGTAILQIATDSPAAPKDRL